MADIVAIGYWGKQVAFIPQSYRRNRDTSNMKIKGFPERLREACEEAGLAVTQPALARAFDLSTTTIWHYLNGEKLPSMGRAVAIASKLGVCVEWLLTGNGPKRQADMLDISELPDSAKTSLKTLLGSFAEQKTKKSA